MSDDLKKPEIRPDEGTESLGKNAYNQVKNGSFNSEGLRASSAVMFFTVILIFAAMFITNKKSRPKGGGKAFPQPNVSRENPFVSPKLLTERDLTNFIPRAKEQISRFGKIAVFSLRNVEEIPVGSEVTAVLESGATDGILKARMTAPLIVDGESVVPENSILFGKGKSGEERLQIEFRRVILPTGESYPITARAFDKDDKILGLKGDMVGTKTKKMAMAMGFGFLGGMADGMQSTSGTSIFMSGQKPAVRDAALAGTGKAALDQSQSYIEEMKNSPNIIEVKKGSNLFVIFDEHHTQEENKYERK